MKKTIVAGVVAATLSLGLCTATAAEPEQISWDLTHLYKTDDAWKAQAPKIEAGIKEIRALKGTLGTADGLLHAQKTISDHYRLLAQFYVYASLGSDEDVRDQANLEKVGLAGSLWAQTSQALAWASPELIKIGKDTVDQFIAQTPGLYEFKKSLTDTLRMEKFTLNEKAEEVMANASEVLGGAGDAYNILANAVIQYPEIEIDGEKVTLNAAGYGKYRGHSDRDTRKRVFDAYWSKWKQYEALAGSLLSTHVKGHVFTANSRGFKDTLEAAVYGNNIPTDVYTRLLEETNKNLPRFHRYLKLRQRMLGLEDLHYHDSYVTTSSSSREFSWQEAKDLTLVSLQPFGQKYLELMEGVLNSDKIHVYPQPGKRSGAYVQGAAYDVSPYMLMNFDGSFDEVSTLSHEAGHFVHSLLSKENNPFSDYFYSTFTAELASTTNEVLLQEYMFKQDLSDEERLFYLDRAMGGIRGTFFRQAQFAEFERAIHEVVEKGQPLSGQTISKMYLNIARRYYGHDEGIMEIDESIASEWMMISHFYTNHYVYQYSTSITGGTAFAERMRNGDEKASVDYLNVLKAGGSEYPYQLLASNGIDLAAPEPYQILMNRFDRLMDEAEAILDKMGK